MKTVAEAHLSSAEIKARLASLESELASLKDDKLPAALKSSALAFVGNGRATDEAASVRTQIRQTADLILGLRDLAEEREIAELEGEIERREAAFSKEQRRVDELHVVATRPAKLSTEIEGRGVHELSLGTLRDRKERNVDFATYEAASLALLDQRTSIEALKQRRCELTGERYFPPPKTFAGL